MRPRGESASSPHRTYVGQAGKQKPQCTQSSMSSRDGGCVESKIDVEVALGTVVILAATDATPRALETRVYNPTRCYGRDARSDATFFARKASRKCPARRAI